VGFFRGDRFALVALCWVALAAALVGLWRGVPAHAQSGSAAEYQIYPVRHKAVAEVEGMLAELLRDLGAETHLVADERGNQILLRGPAKAQQIARQLIETVDRPPPTPLAEGKSVLKAYRCPPDRLVETADRLRAAFAENGNVRVAADPQTSQLLIVAPPGVQDAIARELAPAPDGVSPRRLADGPVSDLQETLERTAPLAHRHVQEVESSLKADSRLAARAAGEGERRSRQLPVSGRLGPADETSPWIGGTTRCRRAGRLLGRADLAAHRSPRHASPDGWPNRSRGARTTSGSGQSQRGGESLSRRRRPATPRISIAGGVGTSSKRRRPEPPAARCSPAPRAGQQSEWFSRSRRCRLGELSVPAGRERAAASNQRDARGGAVDH